MKSKLLSFAIFAVLIFSIVPASGHGSGVLVEDQEIGHGNVFVIDSLNITETNLWVVVHHDDGGSPGGIEAKELVPKGHYVDYNFTFKEIDHDETLWVMLHNDTDGNEVFDAGTDEPRTKNGEVIQDNFVLSAHAHEDEPHDDNETTTGDAPGFILPGTLMSIAAVMVLRRDR